MPLVLALSADRIAVASSVTFAFALAASTFCPLLVLGIWWRGLTAPGAIAGLIGGGLCAGVAPDHHHLGPTREAGSGCSPSSRPRGPCPSGSP